MGAGITVQINGMRALKRVGLDEPVIAAGNVLNDKFYEVSGYFSMTQHFRPPGIVAIRKATWDGLSEEQQAIRDLGAG